jgi:hypothetical protein
VGGLVILADPIFQGLAISLLFGAIASAHQPDRRAAAVRDGAPQARTVRQWCQQPGAVPLGC